MKPTLLKNLKKGEYFTLKANEEPNERLVWVKGDYNRTLRKYEIHKFCNAYQYNYRGGNVIVWIDFEF